MFWDHIIEIYCYCILVLPLTVIFLGLRHVLYLQSHRYIFCYVIAIDCMCAWLMYVVVGQVEG